LICHGILAGDWIFHFIEGVAGKFDREWDFKRPLSTVMAAAISDTKRSRGFTGFLCVSMQPAFPLIAAAEKLLHLFQVLPNN